MHLWRPPPPLATALGRGHRSHLQLIAVYGVLLVYCHVVNFEFTGWV